jgi:uncharacterized membrane protein YdbT with pleckstrin-like domain
VFVVVVVVAVVVVVVDYDLVVILLLLRFCGDSNGAGMAFRTQWRPMLVFMF